MFTSHDVARLAGVSQSTVSYVMSGKRPISAETRRRVEEAIAELTYQPNAGARALASQRTQVIGLVAPFGAATDPGGILPFLEVIAAGVRARDHDLLVMTADEGADGLVRVAGRRIVDALVIMEVGAHDERIPVAAGLHVPVVLIGLPDDPRGLPCVDLDFELAGRLGVEELARSGSSEVVVLGHPQAVIDRDINYVRRFQSGAADAATRTGLPYRLVAPVEHGRAAIDAALNQALTPAAGTGGRPGLLVPHSATIAGVLRGLTDRGLEPGVDVDLVGLCTDTAAVALEPAVTNVSMEPRDVSRRAVSRLFALLAADEPAPAGPGTVELVPSCITRRETTRA